MIAATSFLHRGPVLLAVALLAALPATAWTQRAAPASPAAVLPDTAAESALMKGYRGIHFRAKGLATLRASADKDARGLAEAQWNEILGDLRKWADMFHVKLGHSTVTSTGVGSVGAGPPPGCNDLTLRTEPERGHCFLEEKTGDAEHGWTCKYLCVPSDVITALDLAGEP